MSFLGGNFELVSLRIVRAHVGKGVHTLFKEGDTLEKPSGASNKITRPGGQTTYNKRC